VCRKAYSRKIQRITTLRLEKSRTPTQLIQRVTAPKKGRQATGLCYGVQAPKNAFGEVSANVGSPVEVEPASSGSRSK
jgi:hypothetical protein